MPIVVLVAALFDVEAQAGKVAMLIASVPIVCGWNSIISMHGFEGDSGMQ